MNILFISGGLNPMYLMLYDKLLKDGHFLTIVFYGDGDYIYNRWKKSLEEKYHNQVEVCSRNFFKKKNLAQKRRYDRYVLKERSFFSIELAFIARMAKKKIFIITDMCGCRFDEHAQSFLWKFRRWFFDFVFSPSIIAKTYAVYFFYVNQKKSCVFIPYSSFYNTDRLAIDVSEKEIKIIFIGRMCEEKGVDVLWNSLEDLSKKFSDFKIQLTLIGKGNLVDKIPKNLNIEYLGFVDNLELQNIIKQHHLLVLPSAGDTFGIPVVEALACGVPVVVTKYVGSMLYYVIDRLNGLVIDNSSQLYDCLEEYADNFKLRQQLQFHARRLVHVHDPYPMAERYYKFLTEE